jgi:hypothetical protein
MNFEVRHVSNSYTSIFGEKYSIQAGSNIFPEICKQQFQHLSGPELKKVEAGQQNLI